MIHTISAGNWQTCNFCDSCRVTPLLMYLISIPKSWVLVSACCKTTWSYILFIFVSACQECLSRTVNGPSDIPVRWQAAVCVCTTSLTHSLSQNRFLIEARVSVCPLHKNTPHVLLTAGGIAVSGKQKLWGELGTWLKGNRRKTRTGEGIKATSWWCK